MLSIHKNEKITRTVPILKSNFQQLLFRFFFYDGYVKLSWQGDGFFWPNHSLFFYYFINAIISTLHISSLSCCLYWHWHIVHFVIFWCVFLPSCKITLLATKNVSPPTVCDLGGWNGHHFVGNWVAETVTYHFLNIWSLSSKNMQHKRRNMQKMWFLKKKNFISFSNVYYWEIRKKVCQAVCLVMVNEIKLSNLFHL